MSEIPTIFNKPFLKGMRLVKKQQVSNAQFSDQNCIFLWMPKVSWSEDINLYIKGENLNTRHFNFSGIKDVRHSKKFNSKTKKHCKRSKLNTKSKGYLLLLRLHDDEILRKLARDIQCKVAYANRIPHTQCVGWFTHSQKDWANHCIGLRICNW